MSDSEKEQITVDPEIEKKLPGFSNAIKEGRVPENILKHSHDADEALKALRGHEDEIVEIDEATNKRILRRIDFNLIPLRLMCIYLVFGVDRTSNARL